MSKIYLEILDNERLTIFNKLKAFENEGYLAGGTALAFQLNFGFRRTLTFLSIAK